MKDKAIAILVVFLIFMMPLLFRFINWAMHQSKLSTEENAETVEQMLAESATPWWIGILDRLAKVSGVSGAVLVLVFLCFLSWIGEFGGGH